MITTLEAFKAYNMATDVAEVIWSIVDSLGHGDLKEPLAEYVLESGFSETRCS